MALKCPFQLCYLHLGMSNETAILLQEKIAELQAVLRSLNTEKIELISEIDLLKKEKEILLKALEDLTQMETTIQSLRTKNVELESQLQALLKAVEHLEK